jgi:hypothetical protein
MAKETTDYFLRFQKQQIVLELFGGKSAIQGFNKDLKRLVKENPGLLIEGNYGKLLSPLVDFED